MTTTATPELVGYRTELRLPTVKRCYHEEADNAGDNRSRTRSTCTR